jgi:hypothetical protein
VGGGSFEDLFAFQARTFPDEFIEMERTPGLWVEKKKKALSEWTSAQAKGELPCTPSELAGEGVHAALKRRDPA